MGKKKEKVTYVDDGRTLADMSGVSSPLRRKSQSNRVRHDPKEVWGTYWSAVRMMVKPMLVALTILGIVYMVAYFLLSIS